MSEPTPVPTEPRAEQTLIRSFAILAAIAGPVSLAIVIARATHHLTLSQAVFSVLASWAIALACLGLGVSVMRDEDPRLVRALTLLDFGNEALDDVLCPVRARWRTRPGARIAFASAAAACWLISVIYSVQMALGVYDLAPLAELFILIWFLAGAIWSTVIVVTAPAQVRRAAALALACDAHRAQRAQRRRAEAVAEGAATGETGEFQRPLWEVYDPTAAEGKPVRRRERHYGAS